MLTPIRLSPLYSACARGVKRVSGELHGVPGAVCAGGGQAVEGVPLRGAVVVSQVAVDLYGDAPVGIGLGGRNQAVGILAGVRLVILQRERGELVVRIELELVGAELRNEAELFFDAVGPLKRYGIFVAADRALGAAACAAYGEIGFSSADAVLEACAGSVGEAGSAAGFAVLVKEIILTLVREPCPRGKRCVTGCAGCAFGRGGSLQPDFLRRGLWTRGRMERGLLRRRRRAAGSARAPPRKRLSA